MVRALALFALLLSPPPTSGSPVGTCEPAGGPSLGFTEDDRKEVYDRVIAACEERGASESMCKGFMVAVTWRESRGNSSVRHGRGRDEDGRKENGLGAMGHSLRWQRDKWPGDHDDPEFCIPEVNFVVEFVIVWRAFRRYHAENWIDVQAVMSGNFACDYDEHGRSAGCYAAPTAHDVAIICGPMGRLGYNCREKLNRKMLGEWLPHWERREFVESLVGPGVLQP